MSSGEKAVVFNTRERALSTDHNRLQSFIARDRSQLARYQYNDKRSNWYNLPGVSTPYVGGETPLAADVYGGLLVQPGSTSLLVSPGELGCLFPDPSITADDSPYMLIDDPGVQTVGILVFSANDGGGPRVDLVECQPVATVLESDSRDIFNPSTGLFTPSSVPKVTAFRLQYRITLGSPGSGLPALTAGWLPIAAIVVGTAAASFSDCDFYDVRPLIDDRVPSQPANSGSPNAGYHPVQRAEFATQVNSGATCIGGFAISDFNGYIAGGELRRSTPSFTGTRGGTGVGDGDPNFINLSLAENQDTGFGLGHDFYIQIIALFPGYLPRWVRYSQSAVSPFGRVPRGPRGIVVVTSFSTGLRNGSVGLRTTPVFANAPGVVLGIVKANTGGTDYSPCNTQEKWTRTTEPTVTTSSTTVGQVVKSQLIADEEYPTSAKSVLVRVLFGFHADSAGNTGIVDVLALDGSGVAYASCGSFHAFGVDTNPRFITMVFEVPIVARATFDTTVDSNTNFTLQFSCSGTITPISVQEITVIGWKLGS